MAGERGALVAQEQFQQVELGLGQVEPACAAVGQAGGGVQGEVGEGEAGAGGALAVPGAGWLGTACTGATITFLAGVLYAAGWLWSATDGRFDDMPLGRFLLTAVLLVPAVAASFVVAPGGGFPAMAVTASARAGSGRRGPVLRPAPEVKRDSQATSRR
ncbi:hypothetical protein [Kitasatospora sp. NPDC018614]|uniref:hypothetical protein n=1 Tax=Kitasatospora sp. NPDC018614 TaxID=3364026 RepID=UPI00379392E0